MPTSTSPSPTTRPFSKDNPSTRFQLCLSLLETMRSHSRSLDELNQLRELRRRGLVYRDGIHSGRQFVEAYLIHQKRKIDDTIARLETTRRKAYALIELADALEACESTSPRRFTPRHGARRRFPLVPSMTAGLGRMRASL